jgi:hypothetical protein
MNRNPRYFHPFVLLAIAGSIAALIGLGGCGKDNPEDARTIYTLTYSLNITGESTVDSVTYTLGGGDVTQQNPADGWSVQFPGGDGQNVGASADGTVKNGSIILTMSAVTPGAAPITGEDECTDVTGIDTACNLVIPKVTLP